MNNNTNAQLAIMTYIRVKVPFSESISGSPLQLPENYKLLTHLSRKQNSALLWGISVCGIYWSFRGLIIYSFFSKVNICKLHKSNLFLKQYFSSWKSNVFLPVTLSTSYPLPHTHMHVCTHTHTQAQESRTRHLAFVYIL